MNARRTPARMLQQPGLLQIRIFTLVLGLSIIVGHAQPVQHERWAIKTSYRKQGGETKQIKLSTLLKLGTPELKSGEREKDYAEKVFTQKFKGFAEGDFVETSGWLHFILYSDDDDDYHVQISGKSNNGNNCVIVEIPKPSNAGDASSRAHWTRARAFIDSLNGGKSAPKAGKPLKHPIHVVVRGQLFYDLSHKDPGSRGRGGMKAKTSWEIHPVWEIRAKLH